VKCLDAGQVNLRFARYIGATVCLGPHVNVPHNFPNRPISSSVDEHRPPKNSEYMQVDFGKREVSAEKMERV